MNEREIIRLEKRLTDEPLPQKLLDDLSSNSPSYPIEKAIIETYKELKHTSHDARIRTIEIIFDVTLVRLKNQFRITNQSPPN